MDLHTTFEVSVIVACAASCLMSVCLTILVIYGLRRLSQMGTAIDQLKVIIDSAAVDSREVGRSLTHISNKVASSLDSVNSIIHVAQDWTHRADRVVQEVGTAVEPPLLGVLRNIQLFQTGASVFFKTLSSLKNNHHHNGSYKKENEHV